MAAKKIDEQEQATDSGPTRYVVVHGGVGPWWGGQEITDEHLDAVPGLSKQRLLDLGAIAEVGTEAEFQARRDGLPTKTPEDVPVTTPLAVPATPAAPPAVDPTKSPAPGVPPASATTGGGVA